MAFGFLAFNIVKEAMTLSFTEMFSQLLFVLHLNQKFSLSP